jgi:hypothetical protein
MFIYRGKFNWDGYAQNTPFTIIFPSEFDLGDDAFASWTYWDKSQVILVGSVDSVTPVSNRIGLFYNPTIWVDVTFPDGDPDRKTLTADVYHSYKDVNTRPSPSTLTLVYHLGDDFQLPTTSLTASPVSRIYYGALPPSNPDAKNELFILVVPNLVLATESLCAYWMQTDKTNVDIDGSIQTLTGKTITYTDSTGKYSITGDNVGAEDLIDITLTYSGASTSISLKLAPTPTVVRLKYLSSEPSHAIAQPKMLPLPTPMNLLVRNIYIYMVISSTKAYYNPLHRARMNCKSHSQLLRKFR